MSVGAPRWRRALASIRVRLLLGSAFLVIVPITGISFARTFERELLRSEEEGLVSMATLLASTIAHTEPARLDPPALTDATRAVAQRLGAQVRVLDRDGRVVFDTGPEQVMLRSEGRWLRTPDSLYRDTRTVPALEGDTPASVLRARPEVLAALDGRPGRYTRRAANLRGVRLYIAEPVRAGAGGVVQGAVYVSRTTYPVLLSLYSVRNALVRVALASLAVGTLVALVLAFTIARPLRRLTEAAGRIANGERGVALNLAGHDEIAELARDFDHMARALDARLAYISELAANVSHEFKTPIASMRGAAELLRDGAADDPEARQVFLSNILDDAERLSRLVSRLLELSRIEARAEARVPVDYRALVDDVVRRYEGAALVWSAQYEHLRATPEQVETVLVNLLDNAARATRARVVREGETSEDGGRARIEVRVEGDEHGFLTTVRDGGVGISEANLARVWDRFFTTARAEGGTGLGLPIARAIVESHGGHVGLRSVAGEGAAFWFTLPRRL